MSVVGVSKPSSLAERELLMGTINPPSSGFTPRPAQSLALRKKPRSMLDIECKHYLRCSAQECVHGHLPVEYRLWLEAGKYHAPFPAQPDPNYNSNVWRNFRQQYGFDLKSDGRNMSEVIATMYPLNIPAPSRIGDNTFAKYIAETKLFKNEKFKSLAIQRTSTDIQEFRRLQVKSRARNPPLDEQGKILPPENFKKYHHRFIPPKPSELEVDNDSEGKIDMFGQRTPVSPQSRPYLWKLTSKLNQPQYQKIKEEVDRRAAAHIQKTARLKRVPNVTFQVI